MTRRLLAVAALTVATLALSPGRAEAYTTLYPSQCPSGPVWLNQPSTWYLHQAGYPGLSLETLKTRFESAWATWSEPCCSSWQVSYLGTTSVSATANDVKNVIEFERTAWPSALGSATSTIAVTLPAVALADCTIRRADMVFNAVGFQFVDGHPSGSGKADLVSIAVHEMGHWLGLDHSSVSGSSMSRYYSGGTNERTLHQDDIDAVCHLYPKSCTSPTPPGCTSDTQCASGQVCQGGSCVAAAPPPPPPPLGEPCGSGHCALDQVCDPATDTCLAAAGCPGLGNSCTESGGGDCTSANDLCLSPDGASWFCSCYCTADADCTADSRCHMLGNNTGVCVPESFLRPCADVVCSGTDVCNEATGACEPQTSVDPPDSSPDISPDTADTSATVGTRTPPTWHEEPDGGATLERGDTVRADVSLNDDAWSSSTDAPAPPADSDLGLDTRADVAEGAELAAEPGDDALDCACSGVRTSASGTPAAPLAALAGLGLGALLLGRRRRQGRASEIDTSPP